MSVCLGCQPTAMTPAVTRGCSATLVQLWVVLAHQVALQKTHHLPPDPPAAEGPLPEPAVCFRTAAGTSWMAAETWNPAQIFSCFMIIKRFNLRRAGRL